MNLVSPHDNSAVGEICKWLTDLLSLLTDECRCFTDWCGRLTDDVILFTDECRCFTDECKTLTDELSVITDSFSKENVKYGR